MGAVARKTVSVVEDILAEERPRLEACAASHGVPVGDVPDVVQTVVVRTWQWTDLPESRDEVIRILLALIKWESMAAVTGRARSPEQLCTEADDILQYAAESDDEIIAANRKLLRRAVPFLSATYREVVARVVYEDKSVTEIAAALGTSREDVWQRLSRARVKLREIIDGLERDDLASCAAAVPLLALLAMFESRSFARDADPPLERPDAWTSAVPAQGDALPAGLVVRGPARLPGLGSGTGATSKALASLGLVSAAAAFTLFGDVPLVPVAFAPVEIDAALIVPEPHDADASGDPSASMLAPASTMGTVPGAPPKPVRRNAKDHRFLRPRMYSPLKGGKGLSGRGG